MSIRRDITADSLKPASRAQAIAASRIPVLDQLGLGLLVLVVLLLTTELAGGVCGTPR